MQNIIFDSSAVLALLKQEDGHEVASAYLEQAIISTVNVSEIISVLVRDGVYSNEVSNYLESTFLHIEDFNLNQAKIAGSLFDKTKKYGLSFGDRACLALAKEKKLSVLTADKVWKKVDVGVDIKLIR